MYRMTFSASPHRHRAILDALSRGLQPIHEQLSLSQLLALVIIAREPGLSVNDVAERMRVTQQAASRTLGTLAGRYAPDAGERPPELVRQEISKTDPRRRAVYLTDAGLDLLEDVLEAFLAGGEGK